MNDGPELLTLRLLAEQERYGYEIVQTMRARTGDVVTTGDGVAYPVFHGLEQNGALKSRRKAVQGRSRIYHSLTPKGKKRLAKMTMTWESLAGAIGACWEAGMQ
jgi:PadR family transcriptional regulator, regulatory protein PadR